MATFCNLIFFLSIALGQAPPPIVHVFNQSLDHFDPQNQLKFNQRYWSSDKYYDPDNKTLSTIFFYCGGEGGIEGYWNNTGLPFDIATQFNAYIIFVEHRYYGTSLPPKSNNYYKYLTMEQAIADFATILKYEKSANINLQNAAVIAFGGSYGGILSSLLKVHYPSLFQIALSASAPWYQLMGLGSTSVFFEIVTKDFSMSNGKCPDTVRNGFKQMYQEYVYKDNYKPLKDIFNTCNDITIDNFDNFINWIRNAFSIFAQSDYPYATGFFGEGMPAWPVDYVCKNILLINMDNPLYAISDVTQYFYNNVSNNNSLKCLNVSELYPYCSDHCWCGTGEAANAWNYQQCTEIIIPTDTNNVTDMFPPSIWNINNLTSFCQTKYGVSPNAKWDWIWQPKDIDEIGKYIIWSNGEYDPWGGGGWNKNFTNNKDMVVFIIPQAAHHYDLRFANENDTQYVIDVRKQEVGYIWKWLQELEYV